MGRLWTRSADFDYNAYDRRLTEQFLNSIDDECMIGEILRGMALENSDCATREWVLLYGQRVRSQRAQKEVLDIIKETMNFDSIRQNVQKQDSMRHQKQTLVERCKYCGTQHPSHSVLHTAKCVVDVARPTTLGQLADHCRGSSKARGYPRSADLCLRSSRMKTPIQ